MDMNLGCGGASAKTSNGSAQSWDFCELSSWNNGSNVAGQATVHHLASSANISMDSNAVVSSLPVFGCSLISDRNTMVPMPVRDHSQQQYQQIGSNDSYNNNHGHQQQHLTCLKLGKRQYYGEQNGSGICGKKAAPSLANVPRCQVDGCQKLLVDEKDYHRRHKVCQLHSKSPNVTVLGSEQRFCQQCSRFHVLEEFDESKRSCRRRLAGHNERRRKSSTSNESIVIRNACIESTLKAGKVPYLPSSPGRAFSLLSSNSSWISASELSSRSSAALRELINENRAAFLAQKQFSDRYAWNIDTNPIEQTPTRPHPHHMTAQLNIGWNKFQEADSHVTLNLMQTTDSFEFLGGRRKSKEDEDCREIWKSLQEAHML